MSWIRDFLPADIPQARLLFFNYDSTTYNDAPKKNLADIADELLFAFEASELRSAAEVSALLRSSAEAMPSLTQCRSKSDR